MPARIALSLGSSLMSTATSYAMMRFSCHLLWTVDANRFEVTRLLPGRTDQPGPVTADHHSRAVEEDRAARVVSALGLRPSLRDVQDFDGAAALVGYIALAPVGQEVDARGLFPGLDRVDDLVGRGVDHRDCVVLAVGGADIAPVGGVLDVQRFPADRDGREDLVGRGADDEDLGAAVARDRQAAAVGGGVYGVRGIGHPGHFD